MTRRGLETQDPTAVMFCQAQVDYRLARNKQALQKGVAGYSNGAGIQLAGHHISILF